MQQNNILATIIKSSFIFEVEDSNQNFLHLVQEKSPDECRNDFKR
jgi:hypothetical protein